MQLAKCKSIIGIAEAVYILHRDHSVRRRSSSRAVPPFAPASAARPFRAALEAELELFQLVAQAGQLRWAQAVDEQRAVEVVGFVLQDSGHQAVDFAGDFVAGQIVGLDFDRSGFA